MNRLDAAIIGTGPAGLEAAINLKIRQKSFMLFGSRDFSRKVTAAPKIDNYLGLPGISGGELAERFALHLRDMDIEITPRKVAMVYPMGGYFSLAGADETYEALTVILATGVLTDKPLPGEQEFLGRGVGYCATCDAPLYRGKTVAVLGYCDEAAREADFVAELAASVYYIPVKQHASIPGEKVRVINDKPVEIQGGLKANRLVLQNTSIDVDGIFILRETIAPASLVPGLEMENGFVRVDTKMSTNLPGCFAAGDCTGKPHQYMRAAGQGQIAALSAAEYIDIIKKK